VQVLLIANYCQDKYVFSHLDAGKTWAV